MKIKTADLIGPALDWVVAEIEIPNDVRDGRPRFWLHPNNHRLVCRETYNHEANPKGYELFTPSTNPAQGQPILERKGISVVYYGVSGYEGHLWEAHPKDESSHIDGLGGPTMLIAGLRCFVASERGDEVDVPEELLK